MPIMDSVHFNAPAIFVLDTPSLAETPQLPESKRRQVNMVLIIKPQPFEQRVRKS